MPITAHPAASLLACMFGLGLAGCGGGGGSAQTAPAIRNLELEPRRAYVSATPVTFVVGFDLFDPNADVASASFVLRDGSGQFVDQRTLQFTANGSSVRIQGAAAAPLPRAGTFTVELWTTDATGLLSNALTASVDVVPYPWRDLPPDPVLRQDAAAVALGGGVFVIGGSRQDLGVIPGPSTPLVARFDAATDTWSMVTSLTVPRRGLAAAVADGAIYAIGGESTPLTLPLGNMVASVERYDPVTMVWTPRAAMPTARARTAAATVGGRIYVVGGTSGSLASPLALVESYDPLTDTWQTEPPLPHPRYGARAAAHGGRLVVVGGHRDQNSCEDRVDVFDPATRTWSTTPLWYGCCTYLLTVGDRLFAGNGTTLDRANDPELSGWYGLTPNLRSSFDSSTSAATDDSLFVFGLSTAERYQLALELR